MFVTAIVAAGGRGQRFGSDLPKQLFAIEGQSLLVPSSQTRQTGWPTSAPCGRSTPRAVLRWAVRPNASARAKVPRGARREFLLTVMLATPVVRALVEARPKHSPGLDFQSIWQSPHT